MYWMNNMIQLYYSLKIEYIILLVNHFEFANQRTRMKACMAYHPPPFRMSHR